MKSNLKIINNKFEVAIIKMKNGKAEGKNKIYFKKKTFIEYKIFDVDWKKDGRKVLAYCFTKILGIVILNKYLTITLWLCKCHCWDG